MLKGSYTAIFVSVIVHALLLLALIFGAKKTAKTIKVNKPEATLIKSFLYSAPKKIAADKVIAETEPPTKPTENKIAPTKVAAKQSNAKDPSNSSHSTGVAKELPTNRSSRLPNKPSSKLESTQVTNAVKSHFNTTKNKVAGASSGTFSSYERLSRLRKKLSNQQRDEAFADLTQQRSISVMDGEPFPVPKAIVPLTREQKYKQNTSESHVGSITKNDNGTCTIYREQILGSPVLATTSSFACGESKFDKSFREHMQKVQTKLNIPKK